MRLLSSKEQRQTEVVLELPLIIFQAASKQCFAMDFNAAESLELNISRQNEFCDFNAQNKFNPLKPHHASSADKKKSGER